MQIAGMFPEELSRRHAVNTPLLQADVEQHWCPGVTLHRSLRWSLLCYPTDRPEQLLPRMCENCRWGVRFIGRTGRKWCVCNRATRCEELPLAAVGNVSACAARRREHKPLLLPWWWFGGLSFFEGTDLPGLLLCKVKTLILSQTDLIPSNQILFPTAEIEIQHASSLCGSLFAGQTISLLCKRPI